MSLLEFDEIRKKLDLLQEQNDTEKDSRKKRALEDFRYFVENYLPHYIDGDTKETSEFRNFVYTELPKVATKHKINEILAYRGSAKTTLVGRAKSLWRALKGLSRYTIHISDGAELATENLEAIQLELEENKRLKKDFDIQKGWIWKTKVFVVSLEGQYVKFQAFGSGTRIRGKNFMSVRPEDIYCDDLENDTNIESSDQRTKLYKWIIKSIFKLPNRNKPFNIWFLGTVLHFDSPLMRLSKRVDVKAHIFGGIKEFPVNMDLWEALYAIAKKDGDLDNAYSFYKKNKKRLHEGLIVDDTNWLELQKGMDYPVIFSLMIDYLEDPKAFGEEIQMTSLDKAAQIFKPSYWQYLPSDLVYYGGADPALGKRKGDPSAFTVLGFSPSQKRYYIVDGFLGRVHPDEFQRKILQFAKKYHFVNIGFETVQFQSYYKGKIKEAAIDQKIHLPITEIPNTEAGKAIRIESLAPDVNDETILFNPNMKAYNEQYLMYPKGHDDAPDSGEMAFRVARYKTANFKNVQEVQKSLKKKFKYIKNKNR